MPLEQTITIVNNSGKIINTGKHLFSLFKEAKESYQDKKAQIKSERLIRRAQTFDPNLDSTAYSRRYYDDSCIDDRTLPRRASDGQSQASSRRSHRTRSVHTRNIERGPKNRPALTESNLQTLSEVSSTASSRPPQKSYRSPYVETVRDRAVSKMDLTTVDVARSQAPTLHRQQSDWGRSSKVLPRRRSESEMAGGAYQRDNAGSDDELDKHLAYGNIPPGLEDMVEYDPVHREKTRQHKAKALVDRVEGLLDEAQCLQHGATTTIQRLQENPEAAAAVALTLAELSSLVTKMSPAFLSILRGGSPAVFALLASPQFLIGTGIAVGVTIVMFGGWKIVKKVKDTQAAREAMAFDGVPRDRPAPLRTQSEFSTGFDEALVIEEELSTIESWRRGIPTAETESSVELELITPEADRATREHHRGVRDDASDTQSRRSSQTQRTSKTARSRKSTATHRTKREGHHSASVPERKSSRNATENTGGTQHLPKRSSKSKSKSKTEIKAIEDGRSRRGDDHEMELPFRPVGRQGSNLLKTLFKDKREREKGKQKEMVLV